MTDYWGFASIKIQKLMKNQLPIHPEEATKRLFGVIPKRTKDVLEKRFGLGKNSQRMTLDAIGQGYGITRERVRQIEADGLFRIRKSDAMKEVFGIFSTLESYFEHNGKVVKETQILSSLASHPKHENHIYFLLSLHSPFVRLHENDSLHDRWAHGHSYSSNAEKTLSHAVSELRKIGKPIAEAKLFEVLSASAKSAIGENPSSDVLSNWTALSKLVSKNYFGEWGLSEFPEIKPRGVRDLSYMVLGKHKEPLHFTQVAEHISKLVGKKVHVQTVHNELIKDSRFVLVGRGLYALAEWGYESGMVKDIISKVLSVGPLSKDKIIELVSKKRFVKPNTIAINLENKKYFKKLTDGRYTIS